MEEEFEIEYLILETKIKLKPKRRLTRKSKSS